MVVIGRQLLIAVWCSDSGCLSERQLLSDSCSPWRRPLKGLIVVNTIEGSRQRVLGCVEVASA
jgi:hypothetical protein